MKLIIYLFAFLCLLISPKALFAQDNSGSVTISVNGKEIDLEVYLENIGRSIEAAAESLEGQDISISIDWDEDEFERSIEKLAEEIEYHGERLGEAIEEAVENMSIELKNVDPDEIRSSDTKINDEELAEMLEDIEDEYGSEVKNIDRLYIKLKDGDAVKVTMDVTLENGKEIRNYKRYF